MTLLGTGTSQGVPVIGCHCDICQSPDPRDQRLRTSALIRVKGLDLVIDCGPDFRQQMLRAGVSKVDAILMTHEHNDHIIGLDDVRPFNFSSWQDMPVYATPPVQKELKQRFAYVFEEENRYPGAPMVRLHTIHKSQPIRFDEVEVIPIEVMHGKMPVLGFRFGPFAYITDMRTIHEEEFNKLRGVEILVLNALHHKAHHSHLNVEEALAFVERLQPKQTFLTHISHRMGRCVDVDPTLPEGVNLGYDGQEIRMDWK